MSKPDAEKLEQSLKSDPDSFYKRITLLSFYSGKVIREGLTPEELANRREHILWIIEHSPSSDFAGSFEASFPEGRDFGKGDFDGIQQARQLWLRQVQAKSTDPRLIYNAGQFFKWSDDWKQAQELAERAYAIKPTDHDIASFLAGLYWRDARHSSAKEEVRNMAAKSVKIFEQALKDAHDSRERFYDLPDAAQASLEAGDYERAASYSKELLSLADQADFMKDNSDALHYGNIVLGRIALAKGDIATASASLLRAGIIKGNPHLDTFGPNMMLAKELLDKGERKPVLEYFDLCGKFWELHNGKLSQWRSVVLAGKNPDFGANLYY